MALSRKRGARFASVALPAVDNTGGSKLGGVFVYDPNPGTSYDAASETLVGISVTPWGAFSHTANSFTLDMQRFNKLGATVGSAVTLWSGVTTDGVAFVSLNANPAVPIPLVQGDSFSFTWTKAGNGSAAILGAQISLTYGLEGA